MFAKLALQSLLDRKGSVTLSLLAMMVSIFVLLGVEHVRYQAKESFTNTVSGVDLIVGARTANVNLLLYSVFRIGSPTNNISWQAFEKISANPKVKWAIPMSLGDSHKGFRVLGTSGEYFQYFKYANQQHLRFKQGQAFNDVFDVVLGSNVAKKLSYQLGDKIVLAHGIANTSFSLHDDKPFTVVGILAATGTPVDQTVHVSLQGIEAIHANWQPGIKGKGNAVKDKLALASLQPESITACMLGLESKMTTFHLQRAINNDGQEPLLAILPGVTLLQFWQMLSILEDTLLLVLVLVFAASCLGVGAMLLSSIRGREREIQLFRVIGAPPSFIFCLIILEALLITISSIVLGASLLIGALIVSQDWLLSHFGLHISVNIFTPHSAYLMVGILLSSVLIAAIPALSGYLHSKTKNTAS